MYTNLQPLTRQQILDAIKERSGKDGFSVANVMAFPVIAEPGWFDSEQVKGDKTVAYPFNLGIWARQFADDVAEVLQARMYRLNLVFTYVIDNQFYRGAIWIDPPLKLDISVRVTEQRHLKIKHDKVTLASVADDTEFATWRPELSLNQPDKLIWMAQKAMISTTYTPADEYCPVLSEDVLPAITQLCRKSYQAVMNRPGYRSPAYHEDAMREVNNVRMPSHIVIMENGGRHPVRSLLTPAVVFQNFAHVIALLRRADNSENDVQLDDLHPSLMVHMNLIGLALADQLTKYYAGIRQQPSEENKA